MIFFQQMRLKRGHLIILTNAWRDTLLSRFLLNRVSVILISYKQQNFIIPRESFESCVFVRLIQVLCSIAALDVYVVFVIVWSHRVRRSQLNRAA